MATITVRNIEDTVKKRLRVQAAENGRSMEEEVRAILRRAVGGTAPKKNLGQRIHERFAEIGGVELELPERKSIREPPDFSDPAYVEAPSDDA